METNTPVMQGARECAKIDRTMEEQRHMEIGFTKVRKCTFPLNLKHHYKPKNMAFIQYKMISM